MTFADRAIRILHLEDSDIDAEFLRCRLEKDAPGVLLDRVAERKGFVSKLESENFDLILSDYQVPTFEGLDALEIARDLSPDVPFLFVSGAMGEDLAVEALKRGATDYILKDRLIRLPAAIERALAEADDRRERRRAGIELADRELRYRLVADVANDAIWDWEIGPDRIAWNDGIRARFGHPIAPAGTDSAWKDAQVHPEDADRVRSGLRASVDSGAPDWADEYRFRRADGSFACVSDRARIVRDRAGRAVRIVGAMLDLTERREAERERERLLDEAEAANRMKDEFLATLSHELRTPLNAILGWARILRAGGAGPDDLTEGLAAIERNARAQSRLIEDLLDVSRIISGKLSVEARPIDLGEVFEAALTALRPAAEAKALAVDSEIGPGLGPVEGDPARLQQVAWNLLSNAAKFTPEGGRIRVVARRVGSTVEFSVTDTGQGIRADFLPRVFERFRQADGSSTRNHGGLGLGLSIVRQLVEDHGGQVRAESPGEGLGASFTVSLPILGRAPMEPPKPGSADRQAPPSLGGIRVLVVDDEPDARRLVERVLSRRGAEVALAGSVDEADRLVDDFRPDVLLSDIGMPGKDGYDLIRRVRERADGQALPAAALTAFAQGEDRRRATLAGFQAHVTKPVDPSELVAIVATLAAPNGRPGT